MPTRTSVTGSELFIVDIVTCLANLSADEVFTSPKLAAAMLDILPQDLFRRPDTTFLDPVCKSGVFLREIARRLNDGLKDQRPDDRRRPRPQLRGLLHLRRLDLTLLNSDQFKSTVLADRAGELVR